MNIDGNKIQSQPFLNHPKVHQDQQTFVERKDQEQEQHVQREPTMEALRFPLGL